MISANFLSVNLLPHSYLLKCTQWSEEILCMKSTGIDRQLLWNQVPSPCSFKAICAIRFPPSRECFFPGKWGCFLGAALHPAKACCTLNGGTIFISVDKKFMLLSSCLSPSPCFHYRFIHQATE